MSSSAIASTPGAPSAVLPSSDFHGVGLQSDVKEKLRALQSAKKAARASASSTAAEEELHFDDFQPLADSAAADSARTHTTAAAAAASSTPAHTAAESTPVKPVAQIGFGDEDFIAFSMDDAPTAVTPAASGTKRKSFNGADNDGEADAAGTPGPEQRVSSQGAYRAPWARTAYTHPNFTLRLHEEILDFCTYVSPKPEEQQMRAKLIQRIEGITREAFPLSPNVRLKAFGSYATKLYLPISDIDLVLFGADPNHARNPTMDKGKNSALGMLERTMRAKQNATYLEHISGARIPILKFTDKETGVKVDICYEIEGGLKAAEFIISMQQQMPALRPLTLFLKYFLHCRILNDTYKGGIGSFMLQLMLINHLQALHHAGRLNQPSTNLGMLLMSFLECYGVSLNYKNAGLNMNASASSSSASSSSTGLRTSFFNKSSKGWFNPNRPYLLSIENPLDAKHDVGSNSYLILRVRRALQFAYQALASHQHYDDLARLRGETSEQRRKKQRVDLQASAGFPFANPSRTPQTLLSHIVSVNEEIRADQKEVEYEELERENERENEREKNRRKHVHVVESSSEEEAEEKQPSFGAVQLDYDDSDSKASSSDSHGDDDGAEAMDVDAAQGQMTKFEKRFGVDGGADDDEDDEESGSGDDDDDDGSDDDDDEDDEDDDEGNLNIEVDNAPYDDGERFTTSSGDSKRTIRAGTAATPSLAFATHTRQPVPLTEEFIPLSGGGGGGGGQPQQKSSGGGSRKKGAHYNFDHTPHPSQHKSGRSHKHKSALLQGVRTDGLRPNNQLYESNRSKKKKAHAKKIKKPQTNRKSKH